MLVNLMHISVCRYDGAGAQCQSFGESAGSKILSEAETSFLKNIFELKQRKYPGIYALEPDILAGEIRDPAQEDSWILFGPILLAPANAARFRHAGRKFGKLEDIGLHLQICELNTLVAGMILYYGYLTGKELSLAEFLEYNKEEFPSVQKIHEQLGRDLFAHQEQAGIHNPYEQERREQDAIRHGDVAALNRSISETYEGKIGQLAKDPLRHHKNVAIGNITKVYNEEQKFPEMNAYCISKLYADWTTDGAKTAHSEVLTEENVLTVFDEMMKNMDNKRVPRAGRILYVTPDVRTLINNAKQIYRTVDVGSRSDAIKRAINSIDDVKIPESVPSDMMKTKYDFTEGWKVDSTAKQINMVLVHPAAVITPISYEFAQLDPPSAGSQGKYDYFEESFEDVFILPHKMDAIDFHVSV